jgi:hypothetical protein
MMRYRSAASARSGFGHKNPQSYGGRFSIGNHHMAVKFNFAQADGY